MLEFFTLTCIGCLGGFLAGLLGIGGGVVYILIFPYFISTWGYSGELLVSLTIANSIFAILLASFSGNIAAIFQKRFYWKQTIIVSLSSILIALLSLEYIAYESWYSVEYFNILIVTLLVGLLINTLLDIRNQKNFEREAKIGSIPLAGIGGLSGFISALSGLGGGVIIIPTLRRIYSFNIKKAKSISLGVVFFSSLFMTLFNLIRFENDQIGKFGLIIPELTLPVVVGVVIFAPIGVNLSKRIPSSVISIIFAIFLLVVIINKIILIIH
jgi:uncharacterized membrane protein YfcA